MKIGGYVYVRGNVQSPRMEIKSIIGNRVVCIWDENGQAREQEYEIDELSENHPKFGNVKPE
jgi:hypothetical protein